MSDDLIKREDAIKAVWECYKMVAERDIPQNVDLAMVDAMQATLSAIPSADRLQGEWIPKKASIHPYGYDVECSVCGHRMGSSFGYKFCPMCGARMKGADDE